MLAAVPVGRSFVILHGTARENHWILIFGRLKGFDEDHPDSLKQGSTPGPSAFRFT